MLMKLVLLKQKKEFLDRLKKYYEDNEVNKECFKITRLNRFYVFKKIAE